MAGGCPPRKAEDCLEPIQYKVPGSVWDKKLLAAARGHPLENRTLCSVVNVKLPTGGTWNLIGLHGAAELRLHLFGVHMACCGPVRPGYAPQDRRECHLTGGEKAVKDRAARAVGWWRAVDPDKRA
ncbi:hypothetical protein NDU88_002986 [Pleurodeles waltl]|uniref:Uncharacterized protein n=1 Tax=Pleurodeles waltl TaxID=8319 RepID=A0AAV7KTM1_PLEWA|nr:hypothetical protein NDU88_002986 [Pleurodeles waltl]